MALDPRRVADIAQKMYGAVSGANGAMLNQEEAKEALQDAKDNLTSTREVIMSNVADLSSQENWTDAEVKAAAKAAGEMHNDQGTASAVKTFINDCQRAAHPLVRDRFGEIKLLVDEVWNTETEQKALDKDTPTPVRKLFKRRYHALLGTFKLVIDGVNPIHDPEDLVDYAVANDPDLDPERIAKQLTKIAAQLSQIGMIFPLDAIANAAHALGSIEPNDLKDARSGKRPTTVVGTKSPAASPFARPAKRGQGAQQATTKPVTEVIASTLNDVEDAAARQEAALDDLMGDGAQIMAEAA